MDSFRNRLLALIIGLVVATQSVTLVADLANTDHEVRVRADERLRSGSQVVQEFMRYRAEQLSSTVAVLARDSGFREAVASRERRDDVTIIMSTIELAHSMGLKVVAEGVETQETWNLLRRAAAVERRLAAITSW